MTDTAPVEIRYVNGKKDIDTFIKLPWTVYKGDPNWIAPLIMERREHLDPRKNPYFEHAEVQLWLAFRGETCVGRISAQICELHQKRYNDQMGQFGFLEAIDDAQVFQALLQTARDWLARRGMKRISGPYSFSINDEMGVLVEGFDRPPCFLMGHALPYYAPQLEAQGLKKAKDVFAYDYDVGPDFPKVANAIIARAQKQGKIEVRPMRMSAFEEDLALILDIFNDAWSDNWGFVPMTDAEVNKLGNDLKMLVEGGYGQVAMIDGEPAAMIISLPDINHSIRDLDGRLFPFGWAKLLWRLKVHHFTDGRIPLMGVRKKFQKGALGAGLALMVVDAIRGYHYPLGAKRAELSWAQEDNDAMKTIAKIVGGRQYKTYRIYEDDL